MAGAIARAFAVVKANDKLHMAWCVTGIVGCLLLYGVLQVRSPQRPLRRPSNSALVAWAGRQFRIHAYLLSL
jgi:hypothetical protein